MLEKKKPSFKDEDAREEKGKKRKEKGGKEEKNEIRVQDG